MIKVKNPRTQYVIDLLNYNNETKLGFLLVSAIVVSAIVIALAGDSVLPYDPIKQNVGPPLGGPSLQHLFGTDILGRDVLSRILSATPNDVFVSFVVVGVSLLVGALLGATAGYRGGLLDEALMRYTDIIFAIPALVLAISIGVILGPGIIHMMYALLIIWWPPYARLARGEALRVSHQNYIEAAKASGIGSIRILTRHVLPNILTPMLAYATIDIGSVVIIYAGLSYLGLSIRPPLPEWGAMVSAYQDYLVSAPWLPIFPALVIGIVVVAFSILGDGLRDAVEAARIG
jgi:peptide/nickel transport system permease protein